MLQLHRADLEIEEWMELDNRRQIRIQQLEEIEVQHLRLLKQEGLTADAALRWARILVALVLTAIIWSLLPWKSI
jgi:hypothetical protein